MATIVLSALGSAVGGSIGGAVLGLSGAVIGRAAGAVAGRALDQRLLGSGSAVVETGRIDRIRLQSAGEGVALPRLWGQMRVPGHVIWASELEEIRQSEGGGKGAPRPRVTEISYRLSVALALCEGRITGVGRIWADGEEIAGRDLNMRVYHGDNAQMPDPVIAAHEGEEAPAYRGVAYVVLEDMELSRWGNRVPQLSFEVTRPGQDGMGLAHDVEAVAMIPGSGEYALATTPVTRDLGLGERRSINLNTPMGGTDFTASLDVLGRELPKAGSVSLVVSWFGDDLRINRCALRPKVETRDGEGSEMPWQAGGITRAGAEEVARRGGRPAYGGTPADRSVIEALRAIAASGRRAMFCPFILMEQQAGNGLADPYGRGEQPVMPWRGRITLSVAAGQAGSPDGSAAAGDEVAAFFGHAAAGDFTRDGERVLYHGPEEWSYRRFILHYAHLCAVAGGVDAFLIGSEMVGMTRIRGEGGSYPAVAQLRRLAADVRAVLGPEVKISYGADWSEYFGHQPGGGELFFHLDPLWADENIDFIGIDNYMPLSDWRDGSDHLDAHWGRIDNPDYLRSNVMGGEGYDWYYASDQDRDAQRRLPITDGFYDEPWVWRYKDIRSWWYNRHYDRPGGVRSVTPTAWVPESKPVWFTEFGCAALDKATNQPNKFLDAASSESDLPWYSDGRRDDALQAAAIRAVMNYWRDPANNPRMKNGGRMVDISHAHVWCWDARPYPAFPGRRDLWSDGPAWERGHWLNGRAGGVPLASVVGDICREAGVEAFDASRLSGVVRGYRLEGHETGRAALQPLMLSYGFDAVEREGVLRFVMRGGAVRAGIDVQDMAVTDEVGGLEVTRVSESGLPNGLRLTHIEAGADYTAATAETAFHGAGEGHAENCEFPIVLTRAEGLAIARRWLAEAHVSTESARFALPPSYAGLGPGDVVRIEQKDGSARSWRIDRAERHGAILVEAARVEAEIYRPDTISGEQAAIRRFVAPVPVWPIVLDLPLIRGDEMPHAPYLAVAAQPWPGPVAAYISVEEKGGFDLNSILRKAAIVGRTLEPLPSARAGVIDRGAPLRLQIKGGQLQSFGPQAFLSGANLMAIGDGSVAGWELMQFARARMLGGDVWEISERLRGQAGTDSVMPREWPAGSLVVLMDDAPKHLSIPPSVRGQQRYWRIGPARRPLDDASYVGLNTVTEGLGLRPYAPCHLKIDGRRIAWIRRTRIDGDGWNGRDVPLGEAEEVYLLMLVRGADILHETEVLVPEYEVPEGIWRSASVGGEFVVQVAQVSAGFGAGPFLRRKINDKS